MKVTKCSIHQARHAVKPVVDCRNSVPKKHAREKGYSQKSIIPYRKRSQSMHTDYKHWRGVRKDNKHGTWPTLPWITIRTWSAAKCSGQERCNMGKEKGCKRIFKIFSAVTRGYRDELFSTQIQLSAPADKSHIELDSCRSTTCGC